MKPLHDMFESSCFLARTRAATTSAAEVHLLIFRFSTNILSVKSKGDVHVPCQAHLLAVNSELHDRNLVEISEVAIVAKYVEHILQGNFACFDSIGHSNAMQLLSPKEQLDGFPSNFVVSAAE